MLSSQSTVLHNSVRNIDSNVDFINFGSNAMTVYSRNYGFWLNRTKFAIKFLKMYFFAQSFELCVHSFYVNDLHLQLKACR